MNVHCRDRRSFISERVSRSGAVLVAALVCLLIVISILGTMLRATLRTGRQLHVERDRRQAELLLQAGADRAARLLASNSQFRGDTWTLPAEAILDQGGGTVTTSLARESEELPWQLQVSAE